MWKMFDMITYSSIYSDVLIIDYLFNKHIFKIQAQLFLGLVIFIFFKNFMYVRFIFPNSLLYYRIYL